MKKYSFLIYYKTYNEFLESIRNAGVVHIVEKQEGIPDHAKDLHKQLAVSNLLKNTIRSLQSRHGGHKSAEYKPMDSTEVLTVYEQLEAQKEQLKRQRRTLRKDICQMSIWGYFDPETIRKIKQAGYHVEFYSCHENEFKTEWIDKFNAMEIAHASGFIYFITITLSVTEEEEPAAEKTSISDRCIIQLRAELQENIKQAAKVEKQLDLLAVEHLDDLIEAHRKQLDSIDLNKVNLQAERKADENLILLEGWVPEAKEPELISALETQDVYYTAETPAPTDNTVPVLLKNNKFARLFEPIGKLYDLPNYHEIDVTPFFAPFYLLFFGICLGDAGYGLLLLIATLIARRKVKPSLKPIMSLAAVLGAGAVICGILTGTLFGIELLKVKWAWLTSFQKLMVDTDQMFYIALILGAIQIIFAMFIKAVGRVIRFGWAYSLESWG